MKHLEAFAYGFGVLLGGVLLAGCIAVVLRSPTLSAIAGVLIAVFGSYVLGRIYQEIRG